MISFEPLWNTMKEKRITTYQLIEDYNVSKGTLDNLKHNRNVTLQTLEDLCHILKCPIQDIVEIK